VVGLAGGAGGLLAAAGAAFVPVSGRTAEEWAPVLLRWTIKVLTNQRRWVGRAAEAGAERPGAPPSLAGCRFLVREAAEPARRLGVFHDPRRGTFSAVLSVRGGSFVLLDAREKERRLSAWGSVLAGLAREGTTVHRVQWVERALPGDSNDLQLAMAERMVPDAPPGAIDSYSELVAGAGPVTPRHETYLVMSLAPGRCRRQVRAAGGGERGALTLLERELSMLESNLRAAEIDVAGPLGRAALMAAVGAGFHGGSAPWLTPYPTAVEAGWDAVRTDGQWHAVYWVCEWPRTDVGPDFLVPLLLLASSVRAVSLTLEPVAPRRAAREVEAARTAGAADEELRRRGGFLSTARRRREAEGTARRENELADGHAEMRFSGYVDVVAASADDLQRACAEVEHGAAQAHLELRRLYGQQEEALTFTLPIGRGLR